jgi:hypothetical protein
MYNRAIFRDSGILRCHRTEDYPGRAVGALGDLDER